MARYRTRPYGRVATFQALDTRRYRTDQPNGDKASDPNAALDPTNAMLGAGQRGWREAALSGSAATWNVLARRVMMGMADPVAGEATRYSMG